MKEQDGNGLIVGKAAPGKTTGANELMALLGRPSSLSLDDVRPFMLTEAEVTRIRGAGK